MLKTINGNLLDLFDLKYFDAIGHGCNCQCTFGAGLALQIAKRYPQASLKDLKTIKGDLNKLGNIDFVTLKQGKIYNLYTQYGYGGRRCNVNYDAISLCMYKLNLVEKGKRIGLPLLGAGLGGGDWLIIESIIKRQLKDCNVTIVKYKD